MNKIFTLENKQGDILSILKSKDDMNYYDFLEVCKEVGAEYDNDYFIVKDKLVNELGFEEVSFLGGFTCNKKKGVF